MMQNRTHTCGELRLSDAGKQVKISGWMENVRVVSANLAFVVVRDFYGTTQVVAETEDMVNTFKASPKSPPSPWRALSGSGTARPTRWPPATLRLSPPRWRCWAAASTASCPSRSTAAGRPTRPAAEVPLSGSAESRREEKHHSALQRGGRSAEVHDGARLFGDHHSHPDRQLPRGRPRLSGARPQAPRQVLCPAPGPPAVQAAADDLRL